MQITPRDGGLQMITSCLCLVDKKIQITRKDNYID